MPYSKHPRSGGPSRKDFSSSRRTVNRRASSLHVQDGTRAFETSPHRLSVLLIAVLILAIIVFARLVWVQVIDAYASMLKVPSAWSRSMSSHGAELSMTATA